MSVFAQGQTESKTRPEIIRCLKRHIARDVYQLLTNPTATPDGNRLRNRRHQAQITLVHTAQQLHTHPTRLSQLEQGQHHNHQLAVQYQQWLTTPIPQQNPNDAMTKIGASMSRFTSTTLTPIVVR